MNSILLTALFIFNAFLFVIVGWFWLNKKDTASRVGFGIMELVYFFDMVVIIGGMM